LALTAVWKLSYATKDGLLPIVCEISGLTMLDAEGVEYEERRVELSQAVLNEARGYGDLVPIVVWPDGRVEQGFGDTIGCFI
jgi:hypothetical protein